MILAGTVSRAAPPLTFGKAKHLTPLAPQDQPWAQRAASIATVGNGGTGSCTNVGAGGWTGCWNQQMKAARAEKKQDAQAEAESPLPK